MVSPLNYFFSMQPLDNVITLQDKTMLLNKALYNPVDEGVTHINIYSKAKTELGLLSTNFARTPIDHPEFGHFESLEGLWYWLATDKKTRYSTNTLRI